VDAGDTVIMPSLTFAATANAALYCGATPLFVDVDESLTVDPGQVAMECDHCFQYGFTYPTALVGVDFAGLPADRIKMAGLIGGPMIIDASHSLGAEYRFGGIGWSADFTTLSFHPVKHVACGEGGAVLTNNKDAADLMRVLRHHGMVDADDDEPWFRQIKYIGYNYRLSDINAALGLSQLERLEDNVRRRRRLAQVYHDELPKIDDGIVLPPDDDPELRRSAWHIYPVRLPEGVDRRKVYLYCREHGIGVQIHYKPLHMQAMYRRYVRHGQRFPVTEDYYRRCLTLPLYPTLTEAEQGRVIEVLGEAILDARESRGG
jgi:dTDP-4-amino-4,6-dideoxygalactose transaminase